MNNPASYRITSRRTGLAKSGVSVAKLFYQARRNRHRQRSKRTQLCPEADELDALGVSVICGGHPDNLITAQDTAAGRSKIPGIPYSSPLRSARRWSSGLPVVTEVEVAYLRRQCTRLSALPARTARRPRPYGLAICSNPPV